MGHKVGAIITALTILILSTTLIVSVEASTEDVRIIVIPVDFQDRLGRGSPTTYVSKFNGSMYDYWREVSYGKLTVKLYTLSSWLRLGEKYAFYGEDVDDVEGNTCRLILDSIRVADPYVDFRVYAHIIIMHSGRDQAFTHDRKDIHSKSAFCGSISTKEKMIRQYIAIVSYDDPLGVWAHEFGHLLGLPDLYNTSSAVEEDEFVGPWDLMAEGLWNGPLGCPGCAPAGLTSWSRVKLGWIGESGVFVVGKGSRKNVLLRPLQEYEGVRVVKIVSDNAEKYFLLEAREKIGYDRYLPSNGVLILYVDESRGSGEGIVKVIQPCNGSAYYATYSVGSQYRDESLQLIIRVDGREAEGYVLTIIYGFPKYNLTIKTFPYGRVWVNGTEYIGGSDGVIEIGLEEGSYIINTQGELTRDNVRYVFNSWSDGVNELDRTIVLDRDREYTLNYSTYYYVDVSSDYGEVIGGGWYRGGDRAFIELAGGSIIEFENNTRLLFSGWMGDVNSNQSKTSFIVDSAKKVRATWIKQYKVTISTTPNAVEEEWVEHGESIKVKVMKEIDLGNKTKLIFRGWDGVDSDNETLTLHVERPVKIKALWKKNYLVEAVHLEGLDERLYWIEEGKQIHLNSELYRYISNNLRLRFNGWRGSIQSDEQDVTFTVSSPVKIWVNWVREYRIQPLFTTADGEQLIIQPSKLILYRDGECIVWNGERVWIMEGLWHIEEISWRGVNVSPKIEISINMDEVAIPTTLREIKIKAFDLLGTPLQGLGVSVIVGDVEVSRVNGEEPTVYVPLNAKASLLISYGLSSILVPNPSNDLEITFPVIFLTPRVHIALGQIFLMLLIAILFFAFYYIKKPAKTKAMTTIASRAIRRMSLIKL